MKEYIQFHKICYTIEHINVTTHTYTNIHTQFSFPHRTVNIWNSLNEEEIVTAENAHKFKQKLDNIRHGNKSL